jgi:thioredoxin-related protein
MKRTAFLAILFPLLAAGQDGLHFERVSSWDQLKEEARAGHKYIFVDVYATWCAPCKEMDRTVYSSKAVGEYMNPRFIAVKVQMDTTPMDNQKDKRWFRESRSILRPFKIDVLPSYVFFSPDGKAVHKGVGFKGDSDLIAMAADAMKPDKQFYTLLDKYRNGQKDYAKMPALSNAANDLGERKAADSIAQDYIYNYLLKLKDKDLYQRENLEFIGAYTKSSKGRPFDLFYRHSGKVDSAVRKGYSQDMVDYIIALEDIDPKLWKDLDPQHPLTSRPDWDKIYRTIKKKYNEKYADRTVLGAKVRWYDYKKEWPEYCRCVVRKVEKYGPFGTFTTEWNYNEDAWNLFLHCTDKVILNKALAWSDSSIRMSQAKPNLQYYDTYANLLYKMGRTREAIEWEEKALALDPESKDIKAVIDKMKSGEPTWL